MLSVTTLWAVGPLCAAALAFLALLSLGWLSRARAARRFIAALDIYAKREIDRERRRNGPGRVRGTFTRGGALAGGSPAGGDRSAETKNRFPQGRLPSPRSGSRPFQ